MSDLTGCEHGIEEMDEFCGRCIATLRARVAEVERERDRRGDHCPVCNYPQGAFGGPGCICVVTYKRFLTDLETERDAALARVGVLEAALRGVDEWLAELGLRLHPRFDIARAALAPRSERREGEPVVPMDEGALCRARTKHDGEGAP